MNVLDGEQKKMAIGSGEAATDGGFANDFIAAFGEFTERLEKGTLNELPTVSKGMEKWKKWVEEVEAEDR